MKPSALLRAASVLSFLYFLGHSAGMPWTPSQGGGATSTVIGFMKSYRFLVLGSERTYWDFYEGFGLTVSVFLLLEAVVLWLLAMLAVKEAHRLRPIVLAYLVANVAQLVLVVRFFFLPPLALSAANTLCLALALWSSRNAATGP
ncbi:MAG TPA: hypothetical protein VMT11_09270 [Myxococcaceae bacterium]|nr:hypothetical protein [Myxococcaceae bacterium]